MNACARALACMIALTSGVAHGQEAKQETKGVPGTRTAVNADLTEAAKMADVKVSEWLKTDFRKTSESQSAVVNDVYATVPRQERVKRLATYLQAKERANSLAKSPNNGFNDFSWGYMKKDLDFAPVRVEARKGVRLSGVEVLGEHYSLDTGISGDETIVLPQPKSPERPYVTAVFGTEAGKSIWTGIPLEGRISVPVAATTRGCEVQIRSRPVGAMVMLNRRQWYQPTNTSLVRDPGKLEVVVRLSGYKEWRSERTLAAGDSWAISAILQRE